MKAENFWMIGDPNNGIEIGYELMIQGIHSENTPMLSDYIYYDVDGKLESLYLNSDSNKGKIEEIKNTRTKYNPLAIPEKAKKLFHKMAYRFIAMKNAKNINDVDFDWWLTSDSLDVHLQDIQNIQKYQHNNI